MFLFAFIDYQGFYGVVVEWINVVFWVFHTVVSSVGVFGRFVVFRGAWGRPGRPGLGLVAFSGFLVFIYSSLFDYSSV
ncbi:MAG TPA: hypothetical protein VFE79_13230 [Paraburkholderia sp.]|jgi:hypothetical protein|nr:hypothetical protein [Paraburkholderia sp.]